MPTLILIIPILRATLAYGFGLARHLWAADGPGPRLRSFATHSLPHGRPQQAGPSYETHTLPKARAPPTALRASLVRRRGWPTRP
eukprot:1437571-Alexandrium_andersonii.AAC.1